MVGCSCGDDFASLAKNRVIIQSPSPVADAYGGRVDAWADTLTVWAVMEPTTGRELFQSGQVQSRVDAKIIIRYQSTLADTTTAAAFRVKFGSRLYNIKAVRNLANDMKLEGTAFQMLLVEEGKPS